MSSVALIDTCVFLNILNVPAFNQHYASVYTELERLQRIANVSMLLPVASILETGNHIAQLADGNLRRRYAGLFCEAVHGALEGDAPWQATDTATMETVREWLHDFPDFAMRQLSFGDVSIIKEWEAACRRHPRLRVWIWSLDGGLTGYDRAASI